jgi:hypothetical protein
MLRITTNQQARRPQHRSTAMHSSQRHLLTRSSPYSATQSKPRGALAMRALVLLLIILLLIFVCLMNITGGYHVGGPVLGSILLIGFGAANYAR